MLQTVLGAGGTIGVDLARLLYDYADRVRLVGRNPQAVVAGNELAIADLLDAGQVHAAVEGSAVVYLVAGLPYRASVWSTQWPRVMQNTLAACARHGARLVFLDNIYMYDRDCLAPMDEHTPVRPTSRKGEVRAAIAQAVLDAHAAGDVQALIARAPDFYGPGRQANSVLTQTVFERLHAGKAAQWLLSDVHAHSFIYTPDASLGTAMLGNTADAYGEVWHLPTAALPPTGREWVEMIAAAMGKSPRVQVAPDWMLRAIGIFNAQLREVREMAYQYDRDYDFVSDKFNARFNFTPTSYRDGVGAIAAADYGY